MNTPNPPCPWNGASTAQSACTTRWAKHAIGPQVRAQEAQHEAQDPRPIHTLDEIRADAVVLEKETSGLLDEIIRGDSR